MNEKVNVLVATGTMNAGGAETLIMELLREKSKRINYIMLIHYAGKIVPGIYDEEIRQLGIPIVYIQSVGSVGIKRYCKEFQKVAAELGKIDVVHCHLNAVGGVIAKAAKEAGIKNRIVHCHADITFRGSKVSIIKNEIKLAMMKIYVKRFANYYWACSVDAGNRLFGSDSNVTIIPNLIKVKKYLNSSEKKYEAKCKYHMKNHFVLGSIGRIARIKNYELVIRIIYELKQRGKRADFVCFGRVVDDEYYKELEKLSVELGVQEYIHFVGNSTNIPFDIGCFDVFLMPSYSEGFGMAAIEAQAAKLPVLVSEGVPKIIDVGIGLVRFLPIDDIEKWVNILMRNDISVDISDEQILHCFDEKGFNSETMAKKIEDKYLAMK